VLDGAEVVDGTEALDCADGVAVVDLATVEEGLAVGGAPPAVAAVLVAGFTADVVADLDLAELGGVAFDFAEIKGAAAEMLLICICQPLMFKMDLSRGISAGSWRIFSKINANFATCPLLRTKR